MDISVIILAAGLGHIIDTATRINAKQTTVVYGHGGEQVKAHFSAQTHLTWAEQKEQLGTGHAVQQAIDSLESTDVCLILVGDAPLIQQQTLNELAQASAGESLALLTVQAENPFGYGRIIKNDQGEVQAIVEEKDATEAQRAICEVNTGIMAVPGKYLSQWLGMLDNNNIQKEYYLTDLIAISVQQGLPVVTRSVHSELEVAGINNRIQLAALEREYQRMQTERLMLAGATLFNPSQRDIRGNIRVGKDVEIDVNVQLIGDVVIEDNVKIEANCRIENSHIGKGTTIKSHCVLEDAIVGNECVIGPFARLRPGTQLEESAKIGNFVETKKTYVGKGSKINHLAYVGDAEVGTDVNIGAGVITCNYDGVNKHKTVIKDNAFVGSDVNLVAPVVIGEGATIGAGSTITKNAPAAQLTLTRSKQMSIASWKRPIKK